MSTKITVDFTLKVWADQDYHYEVNAGEEIYLSYHEDVNGKRQERSVITFGSIDEMESVAKAMLQVIQLNRNVD